jgi:hypothetical protein
MTIPGGIYQLLSLGRKYEKGEKNKVENVNEKGRMEKKKEK